MGDPLAIVTGAHGFIGRHVARALARRGTEVVGIGHGSWGREEARAWGIGEFLAADVGPAALDRVPRAADVVVHCAGSASVSASIADPFADFVRTVQSTAAVLDRARRTPPVAVVLASSVSVYGSTGIRPAREDHAPAPASPYAVHKLVAERLCAEYGRMFAVRGAIVRLPSVYGPGLRRQLLWDACRRLSQGDATFSGTGGETRDWLHVADAVELLLAAAERATPEWPVVNGGTGAPASVRDVVGAIAGALGCAAPAFSGAARAGDPEHLLPDVSLARSWGWQPRVDWRAGVREYCEWFREGTR